jgi:hypothetical protein
MITLAAATSKLQILLSGAKTTADCPWVACWVDVTTTAYTPGELDGATNGVTAVDIVGVPAASTERSLKAFFMRNADTAAITPTIRYNANGTGRDIFTATLAVGDCLQYSDTGGFLVTDSSGQLKQASSLYASNPAASSYGGAAVVGTSRAASPGDHVHALPALPTSSTSAAGIIQLGSTVAAETFGASAVAGSSGLASDRDHVHGMPGAPTDATISTTDVTTNNASTTKHGWEPKSVAPAANQLNVVGIANAETATSMKTILAATAAAKSTPLALSAGGTSLEASHVDHGHQCPGGIQSITAAASVGPSSNSEVTIATVTLPTNFLLAGTSFRFKFQGTLQLQATSGTLTLKMYIGATAGQTVQLASQGSLVASSYCEFEGLATVRTTGGSGTYITTGRLTAYTSATAVLACMQGGASTTAVDTTAATPVVKLTAQFATSSSTNILIAQNATIEVVKM